MKTHSKTRPNGCTNKPSLRCHEEIMSKCSSYADSNGELICCSDNASEKLQSNKLTKKERMSKKCSSKKPVNVKFQDVFETVGAPVGNGVLRGTCSKGVRSKSAHLIRNHNFEDSVDFIPVKLSTDNDHKLKTQTISKAKQNVDFTSKPNLSQPTRVRPTWDKLLKGEGKDVYQRNPLIPGTPNLTQSSKPRPTWDKLLRGESEDVYQRNQLEDKGRPQKVKNRARTIDNEHHTDECLSIKSNMSSTQSTNVHKFNQNNINVNTNCSNKSLNSLNSGNIHLNGLYISDPASTLDFLIKQLKDRLINQPENENLQTIILDMENALLKISDVEQECFNQNAGRSLFASLPQSSNIPTNLQNIDSKDTCRKSDSNDINMVTQLQTKLEESCMYLQSLCMKQREYCRNKTQEKEQLTIQLAESRRLLAIAKSKEKDYEVQIGEFRLKIQEANSKMLKQSESIQVLNESLSKLKADNEILKSFKESAKRLNVRLKEIANEKEILQSKLGLKELEVEKLKFLLSAKENLSHETAHRKEKGYSQFTGPELNLDTTEENKDILSSLSTATDWTQQNVVIACSSQASSSPRHSPSPYNSWQHISSICQQAAAASELNKGIAGIFQNLQSKTDQNHPPHLELELLSSSNSFWSDNEDQDKSKNALSDIESEIRSS